MNYGSTGDEVHCLSPEEIQRLFIASEEVKSSSMDPEGVRLMFEVCYDAGLRISECLGIKKKDIDMTRKRIVLTSTKGGRKRCAKCKGKRKIGDLDCSKCLGKGKIMFPVDTWVSPELFSRLSKRCEELGSSDRVFRITRQSAYNWIRKAGIIADIEAIHRRGDEENHRNNIYPHILRHSRAANLLASGMPVNLVMTKLRHKNIQTTSIYLKVGLKDVIAKERELDKDSPMQDAM